MKTAAWNDSSAVFPNARAWFRFGMSSIPPAINRQVRSDVSIPNLSNSMHVARLRHIQSIHESPSRRNPDTLVRHFIPTSQRLRTALLRQAELSKLRADPFYYYLVARTKYYDQVVIEALSDGVQRLICIGCGSDTRAYRFKDILCSKGAKVLECDQKEAINAKQRLVRGWGNFDYIEHLPIDLNNGPWPDLEGWLGDPTGPKSLVWMEGVSPYITDSGVRQFLHLLATKLAIGSHVAFDFKLSGVKDDFGSDGQTKRLFRLSRAGDEVAAFHEAHGLRLDSMELSSELCARLIPDLDRSTARLFNEDGLVRLRVARN